MKIGFISDLHIDRNVDAPPHIYLTHLKQLIKVKKLSMLIIGGDISNHYSLTFNFVEELQNKAKIPVYFIPGNHDFWEEIDKEKETQKIYEHFLKHPQSLMENPLQLNQSYTIVGHPAWYNHAVYDREKFNEEEVEAGKFRWAYWQDKLRLDWGKTDKEISKDFKKIIKSDLEKNRSDNIILLTHTVTIPEFTVPMPHRIFDFFNAFIATDDLKDFYKKYPISHQIMGHVHFRGEIQKGQTKFITNSLGYRKEWRSKYLYKELQDSLFILEI